MENPENMYPTIKGKKNTLSFSEYYARRKLDEIGVKTEEHFRIIEHKVEHLNDDLDQLTEMLQGFLRHENSFSKRYLGRGRLPPLNPRKLVFDQSLVYAPIHKLCEFEEYMKLITILNKLREESSDDEDDEHEKDDEELILNNSPTQVNTNLSTNSRTDHHHELFILISNYINKNGV